MATKESSFRLAGFYYISYMPPGPIGLLYTMLSMYVCMHIQFLRAVILICTTIQLCKAMYSCFLQSVTPGLVTTQMSKKRRVEFFSPAPIPFACAAVATIGIQDTAYGCWSHALLVCNYKHSGLCDLFHFLQGFISNLLPKHIYTWCLARKMLYARNRVLQRIAKQNESSK